ncbi:hypothetical protein GN956_G3961 [Arapaima gigas]
MDCRSSKQPYHRRIGIQTSNLEVEVTCATTRELSCSVTLTSAFDAPGHQDRTIKTYDGWMDSDRQTNQPDKPAKCYWSVKVPCTSSDGSGSVMLIFLRVGDCWRPGGRAQSPISCVQASNCTDGNSGACFPNICQAASAGYHAMSSVLESSLRGAATPFPGLKPLFYSSPKLPSSAGENSLAETALQSLLGYKFHTSNEASVCSTSSLCSVRLMAGIHFVHFSGITMLWTVVPCSIQLCLIMDSQWQEIHHHAVLHLIIET